MARKEISEDLAFARSLPDGHLQCRDFGHTWRPYLAGWLDRDRLWRRTLACTRCGTERVQYLTATGGIVRSHYDYAEGYLHTGHGPLTGTARDALRLESTARLVRDTAGHKSAG